MNEPYPEGPVPAHVEMTGRFAVIPEELLYDPAIPADAVRLYGALVRHGSDPTNCFPSYRRLGDLLGRSPRSLPAWIRALEEAGWIDRVPRLTLSGDPDSNGYRVHAAPVERAGERDPRAGDGGPLPSEERGGSPLESAPKESKGKRAKRNEKDLALALDLPPSTSEQSAAEITRERRDQAESLLDAWWTSKSPRPTQPYIGARKVLERLLVAGWTGAQLSSALPSCPIISAKAVELALQRSGPRSAPAPAMDSDREQGSGEWVADPSAPGGWRLAEGA